MTEEIKRMLIEAKEEMEMPKEKLLEKLWDLQQRIEKATNIIEDTLTIMKESRCNKLWYYDKDNMKHEWDFEHLIPKIEEFLEILKGETKYKLPFDDEVKNGLDSLSIRKEDE